MVTEQSTNRAMTYEASGVASIEERPGFRRLLEQLHKSFSFRTGAGRPLVEFGQYASILDLGTQQALAISTDGIGTKAIVAQMMDRYDTVGIDCVAMNANDVLCVGAEPIAMTDYIAVEVASDRLLEEIGKGLLEGARQANISIPGGEISQIREIIRSERKDYGFDLAGTCVGVVDRSAIVTGDTMEAGDVIIGLSSAGIHCNGLTLAREVLINSGAYRVDEVVPELGCGVGEELLKPTSIYVGAVMPMLRESVGIKALCHITSDGFLNLRRFDSQVGFEIEELPDPQPIFKLIEAGGVEKEEMFRVFNMGIGFCVVVSPDGADRVMEIAATAGHRAWRLGQCIDDDERRVWIKPQKLVGRGRSFARER